MAFLRSLEGVFLVGRPAQATHLLYIARWAMKEGDLQSPVVLNCPIIPYLVSKGKCFSIFCVFLQKNLAKRYKTTAAGAAKFCRYYRLCQNAVNALTSSTICGIIQSQQKVNTRSNASDGIRPSAAVESTTVRQGLVPFRLGSTSVVRL